MISMHETFQQIHGTIQLSGTLDNRNNNPIPKSNTINKSFPGGRAYGNAYFVQPQCTTSLSGGAHTPNNRPSARYISQHSNCSLAIPIIEVIIPRKSNRHSKIMLVAPEDNNKPPNVTGQAYTCKVQLGNNRSSQAVYVWRDAHIVCECVSKCIYLSGAKHNHSQFPLLCDASGKLYEFEC